MVLIIGAQEPIMATVIVTTSHPRMMCWGDCSAPAVAASEALDRLHTLYLICTVNKQSLNILNVIGHAGWVGFAQGLALVWYLCQWRAAPRAFGDLQHLVPSVALPGKIILGYHHDHLVLRLVVFHARDHGWSNPAPPDCGRCHAGQQMMVMEPAGS